MYNPDFNSVEFDGFRKNAGLYTFTLSVTEWCLKTNAIGIYSKCGKYGGTYAHKDIAFEFVSVISPVFKLYLIKELENQNREWLKYAEEVDILNVILFGVTAKKWRELNPALTKNSNVRDYASINELTVLSNLETYNVLY